MVQTECSKILAIKDTVTHLGSRSQIDHIDVLCMQIPLMVPLGLIHVTSFTEESTFA